MAEKYKAAALNYVCQAIGPNGEMCCESKTLRIIDEIQQLHENRLKKLEAVPGPDGDKLRVVSLKSWVKDLSEQNSLLVRTIEELEEEMGNRVRLLENKLQETSKATRDYMTKAQDYKNDATTVEHLRSDVFNLCKLIQQAQRNSDWTTDGLHFYEVTHEDIFGSEPLALQSSRNDNLDCQDELKRLQAELDTLRRNNETSGKNSNEKDQIIQSLESKSADIKEQLASKDEQIRSLMEAAQAYANGKEGPDRMNKSSDKEMAVLREQLKQKDEQIRTLTDPAIGKDGSPNAREGRDSMSKSSESDASEMRKQLSSKDDEIRSLKEELQALRDSIQKKSSGLTNVTTIEFLPDETELQRFNMPRMDQHADILILSRQLQDADFRLDFALREKQQLGDELASVHRELHFKAQEVNALTEAITEIDKSAKDKQAALTAEVANKHDQVSLIRRESHQLEERCRQADMQTNFKDGIIKEMRKEIKYNRAKISQLEQNIFDKSPVTDMSEDCMAPRERYLNACKEHSFPDSALSTEKQGRSYSHFKVSKPGHLNDMGCGDGSRHSDKHLVGRRSMSPLNTDNTAIRNEKEGKGGESAQRRPYDEADNARMLTGKDSSAVDSYRTKQGEGVGAQGVGAQGVGAPGSGAQGVGAQGSGAPGSGAPGSGGQGVVQPGSGAPGVGAPGSGAQGVGAQGVGAPGSGAQGVGAQGGGAPGAGAPGGGAPGGGAPGGGAPGGGAPGGGASGSRAQVVGAPGSGAQGVGGPGSGAPGSAKSGAGFDDSWDEQSDRSRHENYSIIAGGVKKLVYQTEMGEDGPNNERMGYRGLPGENQGGVQGDGQGGTSGGGARGGANGGASDGARGGASGGPSGGASDGARGGASGGGRGGATSGYDELRDGLSDRSGERDKNGVLIAGGGKKWDEQSERSGHHLERDENGVIIPGGARKQGQMTEDGPDNERMGYRGQPGDNRGGAQGGARGGAQGGASGGVRGGALGGTSSGYNEPWDMRDENGALIGGDVYKKMVSTNESQQKKIAELLDEIKSMDRKCACADMTIKKLEKDLRDSEDQILCSAGQPTGAANPRGSNKKLDERPGDSNLYSEKEEYRKLAEKHAAARDVCEAKICTQNALIDTLHRKLHVTCNELQGLVQEHNEDPLHKTESMCLGHEELHKSFEQLDAIIKTQVCSKDVISKVEEMKISLGIMKNEIDNTINDIDTRKVQSKCIEKIIGDLQALLELSANELQGNFMSVQSGVFDISLLISNSQCLPFNPIEYDTQFQSEHVATDEMKEEMNRLISELKLRDKQIYMQERTIGELKRTLNATQKDLCLLQNKIEEWDLKEVKPAPKSGKLSFEMPTTNKTKLLRGVSFAEDEDIQSQNIARDGDYQAIQKAESRLKEMLVKLEARDRQISQQDETINTLQSLVKQGGYDLKDLSHCEQSNQSSRDRIIDDEANSVDSTNPPKLLRTASIEEFRVRTVEAQAALEDMKDEIDTMLNNINQRENIFNRLQVAVVALQETVCKYEQQMFIFGEKSKLYKENQNPEFKIPEVEQKIRQLQEAMSSSYKSMNKSFDYLILLKQQEEFEQFQHECKRYHSTVEEITSQINSVMVTFLVVVKQFTYKEDQRTCVGQSLRQIQCGVQAIQNELAIYLVEKLKAENSFKQSELKLEKLQTELEGTQDELRSNVEHYQSSEYTSVGRGKDFPPMRGATTPRTSVARNYVYNGRDNGVRQAIEEMKLEIDTFMDELEEQDCLISFNDQKVITLQKQFENAQREHQSPQQKSNSSVASLEQTIENQRKKIKQLTEEMERLDVRCSCGDQSIEELTKELQDIKDDALLSKELLPTLEEQQTIVDEYSRSTKSLEKELNEARSMIKSLQKSLIEQEKMIKNQPRRVSFEKDVRSQAEFDGQSIRTEMGNEKTKALNADLTTQIANQQVTIGNLQQALLSTKQQLEELQCKGSFDHFIKDREVESLLADLTEIQSQYKKCFGEVVKQENTIELLRDANVDLRAETYHLCQDIGLSEFRLSQTLKDLYRLKEHSDAKSSALLARDGEINQLKQEIKNQRRESQEIIQNNNQNVQDLMDRINALTAALAAREKEIEQLKTELKKQQRRESDLQEKSLQPLNDTQTLQDQIVRMDAMSSALAAREREIDDLKTELKDQQKRATSQQGTLTQSEEDARTLQDEMVHMDAMSAALAAREKEIVRLKAELLNQQKKASSQQDTLRHSPDINEKMESMDIISAMLADREKEIEQLKVENKLMWGNLQERDEILRQMAVIDREKSVLHKESKASLETQFDDLQSENADLRQKLDNISRSASLVIEDKGHRQEADNKTRTGGKRCLCDTNQGSTKITDLVSENANLKRDLKIARSAAKCSCGAKKCVCEGSAGMLLLTHLHSENDKLKRDVDKIRAGRRCLCGAKQSSSQISVVELQRVLETRAIEIKKWERTMHDLQVKQDMTMRLIKDKDREMDRLRSESCIRDTENINLITMIKELQSKAEKSERNYQQAKRDTVESANREVLLQKELTCKERELLEKIRALQTEVGKLTDIIRLLNEEILSLRGELSDRECQLQMTASKLHIAMETSDKLQAENRRGQSPDQLQHLLHESSKLKTEINRLVQLQEKTNAENKILAKHVRRLRKNVEVAGEGRASAQKCLDKLLLTQSSIEEEKGQLEIKNTKLEAELASLEMSYQCLRKDCISKTKSVMNLGIKLSEVTMGGKELHEESDEVVNNVQQLEESIERKTLENQKLIDERNCLIRDINSLIDENTLLKGNLQRCETALRSALKKNNWPRFKSPQSTLPDVGSNKRMSVSRSNSSTAKKVHLSEGTKSVSSSASLKPHRNRIISPGDFNIHSPRGKPTMKAPKRRSTQTSRSANE